MTGKERAKLISQAMTIDASFRIGKNSITPEFINAIEEAFNNNEIVKISVLNNCFDDPKEMARIIAERTRSQVVHVIGKKIVLYKKNEKKNEKKNDKKSSFNGKKGNSKGSNNRRGRR